ncbi:MAG: general secretion pathway protein GspK [Candidatus Omnitrophica bacterium]|nr:general secretion pathway protein GspK [Candidatus Omnitrophota bacterium]
MILWVLCVLALIAWGLGRRSSQDINLLTHYRGKLRSYAAARAGINKALDLLRQSKSQKDTLYTSGINIEMTQNPKTLFSHIDIGKNAYTSIEWKARHFNTTEQDPIEYGLRDESGRININALGIANYPILSALLELKGVTKAQADHLAQAIINYTGGTNQTGSRSSFLDLNESRLKQKNKPYENILELLQVEGMTQEIFNKIKDDVTVFGNPLNGVWINVFTANNDVIAAVAQAAVRLNPSISPETIKTKAYALRDGADGRSFTLDDGAVSINTINSPDWPPVFQEGQSNYYNARVVGVDQDSQVRTVLEAVIHYTPGSKSEILSWKEAGE